MTIMSHKPGMLQEVLDSVEKRSPYLVAVFGIGERPILEVLLLVSTSFPCKCPCPAAAFSFIVFESFIQHGPFRKRLRSLFTGNEKLSEDQVRSCMAQAVTNVSGLVHVLIVVSQSLMAAPAAKKRAVGTDNVC